MAVVVEWVCVGVVVRSSGRNSIASVIIYILFEGSI